MSGSEEARLRAARALLGWSPDHLAEMAGIEVGALQRMEAEGATNERDAAAVRRVLEGAGVEFIGGDADGTGGVRLRGEADQGLLPEELNSANDG